MSSCRGIILILPFFFFGFACSPSSAKDYQIQAGSIMGRFVKDLQKVHNPSDLQQNQKKIKRRFNQLTQILIDYRQFLESHPEYSVVPSPKLLNKAAALKIELARIYELDGADQIIEKAQSEAYTKLGLFEQSLTQERINLYKVNRPIIQK